MESKTIYSNTQQKKRIDEAFECEKKVFRIICMIKQAQYYKDSAIDNQLRWPDNFLWWSEVEKYWQRIIERLSSYLNNTASEIHL